MIPEPSRTPVSREDRTSWRLAWACVPLVVWLGVIAVASTDLASTAHTDPWIPAALSVAVRKTAHLVEYAVLGLLAGRALRMMLPGFVPCVVGEALWRTASVVIPFGALVAAIDEFHQSWVPSRRGSGWDVLVDVVGLSVGLVVIWPSWRRRTSRLSREGRS